MIIKKIKPLFNFIITTMNKYQSDGKMGDLIVKQKGTLKKYQKVVAVGSSVREIKAGDMVMINPDRYAVMKHEKGSLKDGIVEDNPIVSYNFKTVEMNGTQYLLLYDSDIKYIIEDYTKEEEEAQSSLILPEKKEIIV